MPRNSATSWLSVRGGSAAGTRLVAYVTGFDGQTVRAATSAVGYEPSSPVTLVPECVVQLDELPRNERGKLDRAALPPPPDRSTAFVPARDDWEAVMSILWSEVLDVSEVGRHDDFFELGGDSLAAEELLARLNKDYEVPVESQVLVAAPTLAEFCRRAIRRHDQEIPTLVPVKASGSRPPLFCVAGGGGVGLGFLSLARHLPEEQPLWALQEHGLEAKRSIPDWSVRRIAARHIKALRTVQPVGPYHLAGHSFGGVVAFEMAHQLTREGQRVALVIVLDSFAPDPAVLRSTTAAAPRARSSDLVLLAGHRCHTDAWSPATTCAFIDRRSALAAVTVDARGLAARW